MPNYPVMGAAKKLQFRGMSVKKKDLDDLSVSLSVDLNSDSKHGQVDGQHSESTLVVAAESGDLDQIIVSQERTFKIEPGTNISLNVGEFGATKTTAAVQRISISTTSDLTCNPNLKKSATAVPATEREAS